MLYLEDYIGSLNEVKWIMPEKNIYINFDNWKRRLFIVGISGSGKTRLSKKLGEESHVPVYETDIIYDKIKGKYNEDLPNRWTFIYEDFKDFVDSKNEEKCIIEGAHLIRLFYAGIDIPLSCEDSFIIVNTPFLKSEFRRILRDFSKSNLKDAIKVEKNAFNFNRKCIRDLNIFIKDTQDFFSKACLKKK